MTYIEHIRIPSEQLMSDEQAILLKRLCDEAGEPQSFDLSLCHRRAAGRIAALQDEIRMRVLPPHTD